MKMPSLIPMPSPTTPSSITLPAMPRDLQQAVGRAQVLLDDRSRLTQLMTEQNRRSPGLLAEKLEAQSNLGHAQTGHLLGELTESDVEEALSDFESASSEHASCVAIRQNLRARLLDPNTESALAQARDEIEDLRPAFAEEMLKAFAVEYAAAAQAFATVLAKGDALAKTLRVDVPMPSAQPAMQVTGADSAALADAMRIGATLDALAAALNSIQNEREQAKREANRILPYVPGQTWRFVRDYQPLFQAGDLTAAPITSEAMIERLHKQRYIVLATADGKEPSAAAAEENAALPA